MNMIDLRNFFLDKVNGNLSQEEKHQLSIHINHVKSLLAKDLDLPVSGLFLLKDMQELPSSVTIYIKNIGV